MDIVWKLLIEIGFLAFLGMLYYIFQSKKIHQYVIKEREFALYTLAELCQQHLEQNNLDASKIQIVKKLLNILDHYDPSISIYLPYSMYKDIVYAFEDTEELEVMKLSITKAVEMVMDGEITDSLSIAGLLKVKLLLDQGFL